MSGQPDSGSQALELQVLRAAKAHFEEELLGLAGVHGLGIGYKQVDGKPARQLALVALVECKVGQSQLDPRCPVPERLRA